MHERTVVVWDVPAAVECGSAFRIRVGVRCERGCPPVGWRVEAIGEDDRSQAVTTLGDAPWPGTDALYSAELELSSPAVEGVHKFRVVVPALDVVDVEFHPGAESAHAAADATFSIRSVRAPDCTLRVVVIDEHRQVRVRGARVVAHPFRAVTDNDGVAVLSMPKGSYRLFVSGRDYLPFRADGDLQGDTTIEARLHLDLGPSDAELWS